MAKQIDVPATDQDITLGADGVRDMARLTAGVAALGVAGAVGMRVAKFVTSNISEATGMEDPSGSGPTVKF